MAIEGGREGKGREGKGREGKGREGKGRGERERGNEREPVNVTRNCLEHCHTRLL